MDGNLTGSNNQQKAFNFFVQNGYTKEQAAGIVGNMIAESGVERDTALELLRAKYPEYAEWTTPFGAATVISVERWSSWTMS